MSLGGAGEPGIEAPLTDQDVEHVPRLTRPAGRRASAGRAAPAAGRPPGLVGAIRIRVLGPIPDGNRTACDVASSAYQPPSSPEPRAASASRLDAGGALRRPRGHGRVSWTNCRWCFAAVAVPSAACRPHSSRSLARARPGSRTRPRRSRLGLVIDARGARALEAARAELAALTDVTAVAGAADERHRRALIAAGGDRLDLLVNNASVLGPSPQPELADYPLDVLEHVYRVNVLAPAGARAAHPAAALARRPRRQRHVRRRRRGLRGLGRLRLGEGRARAADQRSSPSSVPTCACTPSTRAT